MVPMQTNFEDKDESLLFVLGKLLQLYDAATEGSGSRVPMWESPCS